MNEADQAIQDYVFGTLGRFHVEVFTLKYRITELEQQLAEAKARIEELEQPTRIAAE